MSLSTGRRRGVIGVWTAPTKEEMPFMYSGNSPGLTFEAFDEKIVPSRGVGRHLENGSQKLYGEMKWWR